MSDLERLIASVEAGAEPVDLWLALGSQWNINRAQEAYRGSLDAALRLHEALLPGWRTGLRQHDEIEGQGWFVWLNAPNYRVEHYHAGGEDRATVFGDRATADANTPARAWLLAALKALKANTATGGE